MLTKTKKILNHLHCLSALFRFLLQPTLDFFGRKVVKQVEKTSVKEEGNTIFTYL